MKITNAQYMFDYGSTTEISHIKALIDGKECFIPMSEDNYVYREILSQVSEGLLIIKDAE